MSTRFPQPVLVNLVVKGDPVDLQNVKTPKSSQVKVEDQSIYLRTSAGKWIGAVYVLPKPLKIIKGLTPFFVAEVSVPSEASLPSLGFDDLDPSLSGSTKLAYLARVAIFDVQTSAYVVLDGFE